MLLKASLGTAEEDGTAEQRHRSRLWDQQLVTPWKQELYQAESRSSAPIYLEIKPRYVNSLKSKNKVKQNS